MPHRILVSCIIVAFFINNAFSQKILAKQKAIYIAHQRITMDSLRSSTEEDCFMLPTLRDYHLLLDSLYRIWGHKTRRKAHKFAFSNKCRGLYIWHHVKGIVPYPIELDLKIDSMDKYYSLYFSVFDEDTTHVTSIDNLKPYFEKLIAKYLLPQKVVLKPDTRKEYYYSNSFDLENLFHLDNEQLYGEFYQYIDSAWGHFYVDFEVDKANREIKVRYDEKRPAPRPIDSFINSLAYPVIINDPGNDTLKYLVKWTFHTPASIYLKQHLAGLDSFLISDEDIDSTHNDKLYGEDHLISGHLFVNDKLHGLIRAPDDSIIYLCQKINARWVVIDTIFSQRGGGFVLEDLNGDGKKELLIKSQPNMNGNQWTDVFVYLPDKHKLQFAGGLTTEYLVIPENKEIWVNYAGSWYMPWQRTILGWHGDKLVKKKYAIISFKTLDMQHMDQHIEYYENPNWQEGKNTLVLKRHMTFFEHDKITRSVWDCMEIHSPDE